MDVKLTYRGQVLSAEEVAFIHALIDAHPEASRRQLSKKLCAHWDWRQPNGQLRDMVRRSRMLELHRGGHIALPPVRCRPPNNVVARPRLGSVAVDTKPLRASLAETKPLAIRQVSGTSEKRRFGALLAAHHYLGYTQPGGDHVEYLVYAQDRPIASFAWSSVPRHPGPCDRFIGRSGEARRQNIRFIAYNSRFLVLRWVEVGQLVSHLLGRMAERIAADWEQRYGHPVYYPETFVDPGRFRGTCYRAAHWLFLGLTPGRGKNAPSKQPNRPRKEVLGLPLRRDLSQRLCA